MVMRTTLSAIMLLISFSIGGLAQSAGITTFAGSVQGFSGDGGPATAAKLNLPTGIAVDTQGTLFIADTANNRIRKVAPSGVISTVAGTGVRGFSGDGGPATSAQLALNSTHYSGVAVDAAGNLYIADTNNYRIRKVTPDGIISTVAGGAFGSGGDGGPAALAQFHEVWGVAVDFAGNLYIYDELSYRVRKVSASGIVSTVAGNGTPGSSGDGGPATSAQIFQPMGLAVDAAGNLFIADEFNSRIRKVTPAGIISTVAGSTPLTGNSVGGFSGDGGPATLAQLNSPAGLAFDSAGNLFIADSGNQRVRKVTSTGIISTIAGNGTFGSAGDGGPALSAQVAALSVAVDASGNVYIGDKSNHRVRKISFAPPTLTSVSPASAFQGTTTTLTLTGMNFYPSQTTINITGQGVYLNATTVQTGSVLTATITIAPDAPVGQRNLTVSTTDGTSGTVAFTINGDPAAPANPTLSTITTYIGSIGPTAGIQALAYGIGRPNSVVADGTGGFYFAADNSALYRALADGTLQLISGNPYSSPLDSSGDGGPASQALIIPRVIARDTAGNIYIGENDRIRKINTSGVISTIVTNVTTQGIAIDSAGSLYVAEVGQIRKISASGAVTIFAGTGVPGYSGDNGPAVNAQISAAGIAFDAADNLYIAEFNNSRVRRISAGGLITTIAGNGTIGFSGDGGLATAAQLLNPISVAVDAAGNVFIAQGSDCRVRKVAANGSIATFAGNGSCNGFAGDGGPATAARFFDAGIAVDGLGNLYIADPGNYRIRQVNPGGIISTVAGNGSNHLSGDGDAAIRAQLFYPVSIAVDALGNVFLTDQNNARIRKVTRGGIISSVFVSSGTVLTSASALATDASGSLYFVSGGTVQKLDTTGTLTKIAGGGISVAQEGRPANTVDFYGPSALAVDSAGSVYIADLSRVWKVTADGILHVFAGTGAQSSGGDGGPATAAQFDYPSAIAVDASGNVYIADGNIRKVSTDGIINSLAPTPFFCRGVAVDAAGNVYVTDQSYSRIFTITANGANRIAGTGIAGYSGDGGPPAAAQLNGPISLAVDPDGNLFISDTSNHRIRKISFGQPRFTFADFGGTSLQTSGNLAATVVGYGVVQPAAGASTPAGLAIFGFRENGTLVTEAGVPASAALQNGRILAEVSEQINTGLAIANPNNQPATISFYFTDNSGDFGTGNFMIPAKGQLARFLNQSPFNSGAVVNGTLTFTSSVPVAAVALRGLVNERGDFLITTLPVIDLTKPPSGQVVIPHFADGAGSATQIVLVNPADTPISGTIQFLDQSGAPLTINLNNESSNSFKYSIPQRSSQKWQTPGDGTTTRVGSVRVSPDRGTAVPSGLVIFSFRKNGITVTEAGVPATAPANVFRLYAESNGSVQTGIAIANASGGVTTVTVEGNGFDGTSPTLKQTFDLPAYGQTATFLNQLMGSSSLQFQGTLRLSSTAPISVIGIRGRYNERDDFLITTTPPVEETTTRSTAPLFFPHIADSGGYTTQFILYNANPGESPAGTVQFFDQSGGPLNVTIR
jgi:sugar lactone lactonase YvrE